MKSVTPWLMSLPNLFQFLDSFSLHPSSLGAVASYLALSAASLVMLPPLVLRYATWRTLLPVVIVLGGYHARFLNVSGCFSALLVGALVVEAGWSVTAQLLIFFFLGSIATKVKQKQKEADMPYPESEEEAARRAAATEKKTDTNGQATNGAAKANGKATKAAAASTASSTPSATPVKVARKGRDMYQVFATGLLPALICAFRHHIVPSTPGRVVGSDGYFVAASAAASYPYVREDWYVAYSAYLACCLGDTLASEVGMLSTQTPIMLWGRKLVRKGTDGGMTLLGTAASIVGGAIIGACSGTLYDVLLMATYGCLGGLLDSLMGTFLQSYHHLATGRARATPEKRDENGFLDESHSSAPLPLTARKWKHLNALVNVLSAMATAGFAICIMWTASQRHTNILPTLIYLCALVVLTVTPRLPSKLSILVATLPAVLATATTISTALSAQTVPILVMHGIYAAYRLA